MRKRLCLRIDEQIWKDFRKFCIQIDVTYTSVIEVYMQKFIEDQNAQLQSKKQDGVFKKTKSCHSR